MISSYFNSNTAFNWCYIMLLFSSSDMKYWPQRILASISDLSSPGLYFWLALSFWHSKSVQMLKSVSSFAFAFTEPHLICHSSNSSNVLYCDGMGMRLATVLLLICPSSGLNGLARWLGYFQNTSRIRTSKQIIMNHIFTFIYNVLWRCFKYELNPNSSKTQVSKYCTIPMALAITVSGK